MVRPEKMLVGPPTATEAGQNTLPVEVREVVFMGEMTRYTLETVAGALLVVKQTNRAGAATLTPGDKANVTWAPADTRLVS